MRRKYGRGGRLVSSNNTYHVMNPHTISPSPYRSDDTIIITSIDPGVVNCAIYTFSYNIVSKEKKSLYLNRIAFSSHSDQYISAISMLNEIEKEKYIFSSSHYIIVEEQGFNTLNIRIGQHIQSYFLSSYINKGARPIIIEISNRVKTKYLECPKMSKPQRKAWTPKTAVELLSLRGNKDEEKYIDFLLKNRKKDDLGDVICQGEVWVRILQDGVDKPLLPSLIEEEDIF